MKKSFLKKVLAVAMTAAMSVSALAGCGGQGTGSSNANAGGDNVGGTQQANGGGEDNQTPVAEGKGGTIMWLSNLQSGAQYEAAKAYMEAMCDAAGYSFTVVYGDGFNDAAGNLQAVKNGMTNDVVGIIASQDGGLLSIMEEYPEIYVAGYNTDMNSVYGGGENAAVLENDHFLGTIADQSAEGEGIAQTYFDQVVAHGYKKVAVINFPSFAYPALGVAAEHFSALVDEYNAGAADADKIEVVGETTTLEFSPLEDSWFLADGHNDLDCIVAMCAGTSFVFPTLVNAISNGTCSADTKLLTSGYDSDESITSMLGDSEGKIISFLSISPCEDPAYAFILIDNAVNGSQFADWTNERVNSTDWVIDSDADIEKVLTKSMLGTGNAADAQLSIDTVMSLCVRNNPDATYADMMSALLAISVDDL